LISIRTAESEKDLGAAYRFWYEIYVKEMGRHQDDVLTDHNNNLLYDRLASRGVLKLAELDGRVVGTVLTTPAVDRHVSKYRRLYCIDESDKAQLSRSCITTKLMVAPEQRNTRLTLRLACATYNHGMRQGMLHNYIDCNDHLVSLFEKLGFERHLPTLYHPDYGKVNSMHLRVTDHIHLAQRRSPFLRLLLKYQEEQGLESAYLNANNARTAQDNTEVNHGL